MGEKAKNMCMNRFFTRRMLSIDIDSVLKIEHASFSMPWSRAAFEGELDDNELTCYLVLIDGEKKKTVVGYAGMWIIVDEAHVTNIAILPEYRGVGLGEELLVALIKKAVERGADKMTLEVRKSNAPAQSLYHKFGFYESGVRPGYYTDNHEDAIIMWCDNLNSLI